MRYRKKPVVIDAMLYDGTNAEAIREWSGGCVQFGNDDDPPQLTIPTLEGVMLADVGNYIIRGVAGEYYPCKAEIFHATYESAGDICENCGGRGGMWTEDEESEVLVFCPHCKAGKDMLAMSKGVKT